MDGWIKSYNWKHTPTGESGSQNFDKEQTEAIGGVYSKEYGILYITAFQLVSKWNQQHPGAWIYWI
jgi:hypothetical protein